MGKNAVLTNEMIKVASEAGALAGIKAFEARLADFKKERVDRRLRNSRLLLRKYRVFKLHCSNAVFVEQDDEYVNVIDILEEIDAYGEDLYVESIQRSVRRTQIILKHIDTMLDMYYVYCKHSKNPEDMRHYRVIQALYIDDVELNAKDIAGIEGIAERTVYKDRDKAVGILAGLFFGIDSMGMI